MQGADLLRAVQLDLEDDIGTRRRFRRGRAVVVAEELGPLQEATCGDARLERGTIDEDVRGFGLSRTARPRRP
jgi:hypothetical protein